MSKVIPLISIVIIALLATTISCNNQYSDNESNNNKQNSASEDSDNFRRNGSIPVSEERKMPEEEIRELKSKANLGDGKAAFRLFDYYSFRPSGEGNQDYWLKKSAENGHIGAQYLLGDRYMRGVKGSNPKPKNEELGKYWLIKAAEASETDISSIIAKIDLQMRLTKENIDILSRSAESGNLAAATKLKVYYRIVEKDSQIADYWMRVEQDIVHNLSDKNRPSFNNDTGNSM